MVKIRITTMLLMLGGVGNFSGRLHALEAHEMSRDKIALQIIQELTPKHIWYENFLERLEHSDIAPDILETVLTQVAKQLVRKSQDYDSLSEEVKTLYQQLCASENNLRAPRQSDLPPSGVEVLFTADFLQELTGGNGPFVLKTGDTMTGNLIHAVGTGDVYDGTSGSVKIQAQAAPITTYILQWPLVQGTSGEVLAQSGTPGILTWVNPLATFVEDVGTAAPAAGILNVRGGSNINTVGAGNTITINLNNSVSVSGSVSAGTTVTAGTGITATTGNITASAGNITASGTVTGGTGVTATTGNVAASAGNVTASGLVSAGTSVSAGTTVTAGTGITATTGNIAASAGNVTASGSLSAGTTVTAGTGLTVTAGGITAAGTITLSSLGLGVVQASGTGVLSSSNGTNGQLLIGRTALAPVWANLTSTGGTITITPGSGTLNIDTAGAVATSFPTNAGTAIPAAGALTISGGSNINTSGSGSTVTINLNNSPSVSGSLTAGTTITAGTGITATTGNIAASAGNVSASGTVTGGTGVTATTGNVAASSGNVTASGLVSAGTSMSAGTTITAGTGVTTTTGNVTVSAGNLTLPNTNAAGTQGVILFGGHRFLHNAGPAGASANIFGGDNAGNFSLTGNANSGLGQTSLSSLTSGSFNTAIGAQTLDLLTSGSNNIAIGGTAGVGYTVESNNISIGFAVGGTAGESNTLRIGSGTGTVNPGNLNQAFISGIRGITTGQVNAIPVLIDSNNQLGTVSSSRTVKENIRDIGDESTIIFDLRPVAFNYIQDSSKTKQFGLVAEEVQEVFPEFVVFDDKGNPMTVRYHELAILLLNEVKKLHMRIQALEH